MHEPELYVHRDWTGTGDFWNGSDILFFMGWSRPGTDWEPSFMVAGLETVVMGFSLVLG